MSGEQKDRTRSLVEAVTLDRQATTVIVWREDRTVLVSWDGTHRGTTAFGPAALAELQDALRRAA